MEDRPRPQEEGKCSVPLAAPTAGPRLSHLPGPGSTLGRDAWGPGSARGVGEGAGEERGDGTRIGDAQPLAGTFPETAEFPGIALISPRSFPASPMALWGPAPAPLLAHSFRLAESPKFPLSLQTAFRWCSGGGSGGEFRGPPRRLPRGSLGPAGGRGGAGAGAGDAIVFVRTAAQGPPTKAASPPPSAAELGGDFAVLCATHKAPFVARTQVRKAFEERS